MSSLTPWHHYLRGSWSSTSIMLSKRVVKHYWISSQPSTTSVPSSSLIPYSFKGPLPSPDSEKDTQHVRNVCFQKLWKTPTR
jgi:hypothetical protein